MSPSLSELYKFTLLVHVFIVQCLAKVYSPTILSHIAWGAGFLDGIGRRLQELENSLADLADRFTYGSTAPESVAGGLANIRDMSMYINTSCLSLQWQCSKGNSVSHWESMTVLLSSYTCRCVCVHISYICATQCKHHPFACAIVVPTHTYYTYRLW